jgi:hypothetical protein
MNFQKAKKIVKASLRTTLTTIAFLLVLEGVCRIGTYLYYAPHGTSFAKQTLGMWRSDSILLWDNQPGYLFQDQSASFNEEGCRVNTDDIKMPLKQKGEMWVLLSGGSAMLGTGASKDGDYFILSELKDHQKTTAIDGYLEKKLNANSKVHFKVFNGAVSGHATWQSFEKAKKMLKKHHFDWVISMNGQNDPSYIAAGKNCHSIMKEYWQNLVLAKHPFATQFTWMQRSALVYCVLRSKYNISISLQEKPNRETVVTKIKNKQNQLHYLNDTITSATAVNSFRKSIMDEYNFLEHRKTKHLHFIQPHLSLRNPTQLDSTERLIYQYYCGLRKDTMNTFMKDLHQIKWPQKNIIALTEMHHLPFWVFTDYCHLTNKANEYIADKIAALILENEQNQRK